MAMVQTAFRTRAAYYRHCAAVASRTQRAEIPLFQAFLRPSSVKVTDGLCIKDDTTIDDIYMNMIRQELKTGEHNRPKEYPFFIADAYFHTTDEMKSELYDNGFEIVNYHAVEGSVWITPMLEEKWNDIKSRNRLLDIIHATEHEETIMGMSPHFLVIAKK